MYPVSGSQDKIAVGDNKFALPLYSADKHIELQLFSQLKKCHIFKNTVLVYPYFSKVNSPPCKGLYFYCGRITQNS